MRLDRGWKENIGATKAKKGGGLICYVNDSLTMNEFKYEHLNQSTKELEMQWVLLDMKNMRKIVIVNIYRPPQGDFRAACNSISNAIRDADLKDNVEIFLMGDFNINLTDRKSPMVKELESITAFWDLRALIKDNTRIGAVNGIMKGSCIDNIYTNLEDIMVSGVLNWNFSDHMVVMAKRKRGKADSTKITFKGRSYRNYSGEGLQDDLLLFDSDGYYELQDPGQCWEVIETLIRNHLDKTCPQKTFKVREVREPWVSNEILEEIRDKDMVMRGAKA